MEVKLLHYNKDIVDVIHTACRTCYSKLTPIEIYNKDTYADSVIDISTEQVENDNNKKIELIKKVMDSGHLSTTEHAYFTFAIAGVSRALLTQITRHRLCSFSVQSQRYVEIKENLDDLIVLMACGTKQQKLELLTKYFVFKDDNDIFINAYLNDLISYLQLTHAGYKAEDARGVLPQATKTNIVLSCNLRQLMHVSNWRLCKHAQLEIRTMVKKMKEEVLSKPECKWLSRYLIPRCAVCSDFRKGECKEIE